MKCEIMKIEPFIRAGSRCSACGKREATKVIHYHIEYEHKIAYTCGACSQLSCIELASIVHGGK